MISEAELKKIYWSTVLHSVVTFLGQSLMPLVDLFFCGVLGSQASAAVGTSTALFSWFMIIGIGLVLSLEYWIPYSLGEKNDKSAHSFYYSGLIVALLVSAFSCVSYWFMVENHSWFGVNPEIAPSVVSFSRIIALSYFPVFLIPTLRVELQARGRPHDTTFAFLIGNLINAYLNWTLIHGHHGFPRLGLEGCAWANLISRFLILFYLIYRTARVRGKLSTIPVNWRTVAYSEHIQKIIKMGLPTSLHMLFEMGAFIVVGMLASGLSATQNAAHAITISIASFTFMIPLGLSSAAALTLSKLNGEKRTSLAVHYGQRTLLIGLLNALLGSTLMIVFRDSIFRLYSVDEGTIQVGSTLLLIAALFQLGDAVQVILAGCLRGFGQTRIQAVVNAIGHWGLGLPLGLFLGYSMHLEIRGFWVGLSTGLFSVALGLSIYWKKIIRSEPSTVTIPSES